MKHKNETAEQRAARIEANLREDAVLTCRRCGDIDSTTEVRYSLGIYAGRMCDSCWRTSGYRDEPASAFDPDDAGESYEGES